RRGSEDGCSLLRFANRKKAQNLPAHNVILAISVPDPSHFSK
ncbi:hypothetical protein F442_00341, partial [Phytophthora nicotianae P10297]